MTEGQARVDGSVDGFLLDLGEKACESSPSTGPEE